jgi:hypothetical protein
MTNPDIAIRTAYCALPLSAPIYVDEMPINIKPIPDARVLISTQTKTPRSATNCGHTWECSILLDIIYEQQRGYSNRDVVDLIEQEILTAVDNQQFSIPPFAITYTTIQEAHSSNLDTPTKTISRKLIRITHKLNYL